MKEKKLIRKILVTLMAIVLLVTFTFSDYSLVIANTNDTETSTNTDTDTDTSDEKELVQCDGEDGTDGWLIFKYKDENGEPQFDVKYQGKTVDELKSEGYKVQYLAFFNSDHNGLYLYTGISKEFNNQIDKTFSKDKYQIFVQFILTKDVSIYSDAILLYSDNCSFPYIISTNSGYLGHYSLLSGNSNCFKVIIKLGEHLKEIGDLSVSTKSLNNNIDSEDVHTSNLTYNNYDEEKTFEGKNYTFKYSIISFDLEIPSIYPYDIDHMEYIDIIYLFSFNGLVGVNSNAPIETLQFSARTPDINYNLDVPVNSIKIHASSSSVKVGDSIILSTTVLPNDATNKTITWSSSNSDYATVDENGTVTAKPAGAGKSVVITATSTDGSNIVGTYTLNILPQNILVKSIKITASSSSINAGKTIDLKASINSDATNKSLVWTSSNTKYATVNSNGTVTTKPAGAGKTVVITAKATDGSNVSASFNLKINKILVKKIKLKAKKSLKVGKKLKIKLTINSDATNKNVKWSVSNKKYAKINSKGVLTAKKAGKGKTIKVTAKAKDGSGKKATIKIKIKE